MAQAFFALPLVSGALMDSIRDPLDTVLQLIDTYRYVQLWKIQSDSKPIDGELDPSR